MRMKDGLATQSRRSRTLRRLLFAGRYNQGLITSALLICGLAISFFLPAPTFAFQTFEHFYVGQTAYSEICFDGTNSECNDFAISDLLAKVASGSEIDGEVRNTLCGKPGTYAILAKVIDSIHIPHLGSDSDEKQRAERSLTSEEGIALSFGDLSALAGDFTSTPCDLYRRLQHMSKLDSSDGIETVEATRQHLTDACDWAKRACGNDKCRNQSCAELLSKSNAPAPSMPYPISRVENASFERLPEYSRLAAFNQEHFPEHSWAVSRDHHEKARWHASNYNASNGSQTAELVEAVMEEGCAQHFLQDSFASGHIGSAWGEFMKLPHRGSMPLEYVPNRIVLQRSHDYLNEHGLLVAVPLGFEAINPAGSEFENKWTAYGDNSLLCVQATTHRAILVSASKVSLLEIFQAARGGNGSSHFLAEKTFPVPLEMLSGFRKADGLETARRRMDPSVISQPVGNAVTSASTPVENVSLKLPPKQLSYKFESGPALESVSSASDPQPTASRLLPECKAANYHSSECDLQKWNDHRSPDFRVPDQPDEGWKFSISGGTTFGRVAMLNPQSVITNESFVKTKENPGPPPPITGKSEQHRSGTEIFELGYLRRATKLGINYFGAEAKIVNNARTEIYPLVFGYYLLPPSRLYYFGTTINLGVRIDNPYLKVNPSSSSKYSLQFSFPWEFGWEIYPPFTFFTRAEVFALDLPGLGTNSPVSAKGYPIYLGYTSITGGIRLDLTGVLE
jgi:hypothetical protein